MGDEELEIEAGAPEVSADEWMARAALFELLSLGLLKPGRPIAEALASGEFAAACAETLGALGLGDAAAAAGVDLADYEGDNAEKIYHEVLREYTRLFVGTREPLITPFAGVSLTGPGTAGPPLRGKGIHGRRAVHAPLRRGEESCRRTVKRSGGMHIGTMCEFAKFLCLVNARAVVPAEGARVEPGDFDAFMDDHFVSYAVWCAGQLRELSSVPFYRAMAALLDAAVSVSR